VRVDKPGAHQGELPVHDPARPVVGRAVLVVVGLGAAVFAYIWLAKEIPPLYAREP